MIHLYWDASALAKRYVAEVGSQSVNVLFNTVPPPQMVSTISSYSETLAALVRKQNQGILPPSAFNLAQAALRNEIIDSADFVVLGLEFDDFLDGVDLIKRHNLNSADAAVLRAFLKYHGSFQTPMAGVLVASDQRFLRAAKAEGLEVLDPEKLAVADVPIFLAGL